MAKEDVEDKLRKKLIKDNQAMFQGIAKSMKGSSDEQIAKMQDRYFDKLTKQALEERKKQALERQAERDKIRIEEIKNDLKTKQGLTDAVAETLAKSANEREKREEKNATGMKKMFVSLKKGFQSFQRTPEEKKEEAARQGGFLGALKGMMAGKGDAMGKGAKGMFGGIMKTIKKVMGVLQIKFLMIAGFVAFAIGSLKIKDLKKMWNAFTEAFMKFYEFMKPVVAYVANWIKESVLPNLVEFFVNTFKSITKMFSSLKERFEGWGEMSFGERVMSVLGAIGDIGIYIWDTFKNLMKLVGGLLGIDGTFFKDTWAAIKALPDTIMEKFSKLGDAISNKWNELFPKGIGAFFMDEVFTPIRTFFREELSFGSFKEILMSYVKVYLAIGDLIKKWLLNPVVEWLGKVFKFDSSKFTDFSISELFTQMMDKVVGFLNNLFGIDLKSLFKKMILAMPFGETIWNKMGGDEKPEPPVTKTPVTKTPVPKTPAEVQAETKTREDTRGLKKGEWLQREKKKWSISSGRPASEFGKAHGGAKGIKEMFGAYKGGQMPTPQPMDELAQIKKDEGFEEGVYEDTMGIKTIGYGFNLERAGSQEALDAAGIKKSLADLKGGKANLTEEEASRLMQGEMGHFKGVAERFVGKATWEELGQNKQGILTNMAYNMGEGTLNKFKNLKAAIIAGDWKQAQVEMKDSNWAKQVHGRADRLIARMGENDSGNRLGAAQAQRTQLASAQTGPAVMLNKGGDNTTVQNASYQTKPSALNNNRVDSGLVGTA